MLACLWWGQILLDHIKSSSLFCEVHHHTYTAKVQQAGNDSLLFCTTGTFSLSFYLLSFSFSLAFLSFSVLAIWQLILTSAVRPNVPALSSSSSSTPSSSSPRFPSTQVSLIMSDHMIKTSVLLTLKGQFTQKWYFVIIDPPSPWTNLLPYNEKREVEQSLYTIKSNGDWWGSKKLFVIIICWKSSSALKSSEDFARIPQTSHMNFLLYFLCFFIHYKHMERAAQIFC